MKKNILSLLSATMFFGAVFGIFALVNIAERDTVNAKVIEVNENEVIFKVTDFNSNQYNHEYVWELEKNETFTKDENVKLVMFDFENGNPKDDEIVKILK